MRPNPLSRPAPSLRALALPVLGLLLPVLLASASAPAAAQVASLVKDIDSTGSVGSVTPASPIRFTQVGKRFFFVAYGPGMGRELFVSDGTAAGSRLVRQLCFGCSADPEPIGALGDRLLFVAESDEGIGLFASDGTRPGTVRLGVSPGEPQVTRPSQGGEFLIANGRVFFAGCTFAAGCEPWSSDGTRSGTRQAADVVAGREGSSPSGFVPFAGKVYFLVDDFFADPGQTGLWAFRPNGRTAFRVAATPRGASHLAAAGGHLFFIAEVEGQGQELWASDGTAAAARPVSSFPGNSFPFDNDDDPLVPLGDRVYFVADDVLHGSEIWASDGTSAGTRRVTEFGFHDPFHGSATGMALLGSRLLFFASDGLNPTGIWKTDGSPESTAPVKVASDLSIASPFAAAGGRTVFAVRDLTRNEHVVLWATDGTPAGTVPLWEGCGLRCPTLEGLPERLDGAFYFHVRDANSFDDSLWTTDGTRAGTRRFSDLPGLRIDSTGTFDGAALGGEVFFSATSFSTVAPGTEVWASDGTAAGVRQVTDIEHREPSSDPRRLTASGDRLIFSACMGVDREVWTTRGTEETTVQLTAGGSAFCPHSDDPVVALGGVFLFIQEDDTGRQLWRSDGTPAGTVKLTSGGAEANLVVAGGVAYFAGPANGTVWRSDGTAAGTRIAFSLPAGASQVRDLTAVGSDLYFELDDDTNQGAIWKSDGTQAGTRKLVSRTDDDDFDEHHFTRFGSDVYFFWHASFLEPFQLWRTDGTFAGTRRVRRLDDFNGGGGLELVPLPDALLVLFARGNVKLFRSDGTEAGTVVVKTFCDGDTPAPPFPTLFGGQVYFAANDCILGRELWRSDGTAAGTVPVADLAPGAQSAEPSDLAMAAGRLFFAAADGVHGRELWQTDGTTGGTRLVQDIAPQDFSSSPASLTATSDRLYFVVDDGLHGRELWSLPLAGPAGCTPSPTRICLGGRFAVTAEWQDFQGRRGHGQGAALTADTGYFWFFDPANVEVVIKVLDGRASNGHFWVFYGALSSVEYQLTVTDTQTGLSRRYLNPSGQLASVGDTTGFGPLGAYATVARAAASAPLLVSERTEPAAATGICQPGPGRLCLQGNRFAVEATWKDFQGHTGTGKAVALTGDTGYFWFFDPANVEVVFKVIDGRPVNGKFWTFYGALSSVEYHLTVTDVETGAVRTYNNPSGRLASGAETTAF